MLWSDGVAVRPVRVDLHRLRYEVINGRWLPFEAHTNVLSAGKRSRLETEGPRVVIDCSDLYFDDVGEGAPILLIHPSGATASTWGSAVSELARIGQVILYDRRGYARSGGESVRNVSTHTADAAALLEALGATPAVVVGVSSGAMIAIDLAVRRPDLVKAVIEHEGPWRFTRRVPTAS